MIEQQPRQTGKESSAFFEKERLRRAVLLQAVFGLPKPEALSVELMPQEFTVPEELGMIIGTIKQQEGFDKVEYASLGGAGKDGKLFFGRIVRGTDCFVRVPLRDPKLRALGEISVCVHSHPEGLSAESFEVPFSAGDICNFLMSLNFDVLLVVVRKKDEGEKYKVFMAVKSQENLAREGKQQLAGLKRPRDWKGKVKSYYYLELLLIGSYGFGREDGLVAFLWQNGCALYEGDVGQRIKLNKIKPPEDYEFEEDPYTNLCWPVDFFARMLSRGDEVSGA